MFLLQGTLEARVMEEQIAREDESSCEIEVVFGLQALTLVP
jgi:hypothetical protein